MTLRANYIRKNGKLNEREASEICFKCGVCCVIGGHSCHVQFDEKFDAKYTFVYDCLKAEDPSGNENIWLCVSCHKCEEICPYEVSPVRFIEAMKEKAFEGGLVPTVIKGEVENVVSTGYAFPITGSANRLRERLGLKPILTDVGKEIRCIAEGTGLAKKLKKTGEGPL